MLWVIKKSVKRKREKELLLKLTLYVKLKAKPQRMPCLFIHSSIDVN